MSDKIPKLCKDKLKELNRDHKTHLEDGWKPEPLEGTVFYRLIRRDQFNEKNKTLDRTDFRDAGYSVYAEGGPFESLDIRALLEQRIKEGFDFVGAIKLSSSVFLASAWGNFWVMHDPWPYRSKGIMVPQPDNHVTVICEKSDEFIDNVDFDWAVHPDDIQC